MNPSHSEQQVRESLIRALRDSGDVVSDPELLRIGNNYVYADRPQQRVYRVSVRERDPHYIASENTRINQLVAAGAPLLGPLRIDALNLSTGHLATVWPLGVKPEPHPAISLAPTLAKLHGIASVPAMPTWAGFERGRYRLDLAKVADVPNELVEEIEGQLGELQLNFPAWSTETVVHGDPHTGNLVRLDGSYLLIDLDDLALGCPEIDLAPLCCSYQRFDRVPGNWDDYLAAYGRAIDMELLGWFVRLRQLTMVAWLFTLWDFRPESHSEALHRVRTLNKVAKWNPL